MKKIDKNNYCKIKEIKGDYGFSKYKKSTILNCIDENIRSFNDIIKKSNILNCIGKNIRSFNDINRALLSDILDKKKDLILYF